MRIKGASALISGGASGLGAATARRLSAAGAVCTILDRNAELASSVAKELGGEAGSIGADVGDEEQVSEAVAQASEKGPLRIAVNCAGIGAATRVIARDGSPHDLGVYERVLRVNLIGTFNVIRLAASAMATADPLEDGERGVIVNTASIAAFEGQIGQIAYSASKGGIVGMTLPAARDLATVGVRVLTIAPGLMDTPLLGQLPEEARQALGSGVPFPKRMGRPEDFAALVEHICENAYLNGEVIRLDGALRMPPR
jgi:NAD(P)-dependent dehydrogenase (short-subunit alcohol dehydrogenase family)